MEQNVIIKSRNGVTSLTSKVKINAGKEEVWEVLKFPGKVESFHPLIKKSFMTTEALNGVGAKRHCDLLPIGEMDEIITEWIEDYGFTIEVTGGKMLPPHHFMKGQFELKEFVGQTEVTFTFSYQLKFGFLGKFLDKLLIRPQFKKAPPKYVHGLKVYIENKETSLPFSV